MAIDLGRKQENMLPLKFNSKSNHSFSTLNSLHKDEVEFGRDLSLDLNLGESIPLPQNI